MEAYDKKVKYVIVYDIFTTFLICSALTFVCYHIKILLGFLQDN